MGKKTKNDLRAMKQILYDMGLLALVRWLFQRAFKFEPPFRPGSELKRAPPPKNWKTKCVLKWLLCQIQCFKPMLLFFFDFLVENRPSHICPPLLIGPLEEFCIIFLDSYLGLGVKAQNPKAQPSTKKPVNLRIVWKIVVFGKNWQKLKICYLEIRLFVQKASAKI